MQPSILSCILSEILSDAFWLIQYQFNVHSGTGLIKYEKDISVNRPLLIDVYYNKTYVFNSLSIIYVNGNNIDMRIAEEKGNMKFRRKYMYVCILSSLKGLNKNYMFLLLMKLL